MIAIKLAFEQLCYQSSMAFFLVIVLFGPHYVRSEDKSAGEGLDRDFELRKELVDRVQLQGRLFRPQNPIEIHVKSEHSETFSGTTHQTRRASLRYIIDIPQETFLVVYRNSPKLDFRDGEVRQLAIGGVKFVGGKGSAVSSGSNRIVTFDFPNFDSAIESSEVPLPFNFATLTFPSFSPADKALLAVLDIITDDANAVSVTSSGTLLKYNVRIDHEPTRWDDWSWTFDIQSGAVVRRQIYRAIRSKPRRYFDYQINWEKSVNGGLRPTDTIYSYLAIRDQEGFVGGVQSGEGSVMVSFEYPPASSIEVDTIETLDLEDPAALVEFVEEIN